MRKSMPLIQLIVIAVCFVSLSDADVTLSSVNSLDGEGIMECGSKVILVCQLQANPDTMMWKVDNTNMMSCTAGACQTHPPYLPNYGFAFQRAKGIFNLTINPVTFKENGKVFECNDGTMSAIITAAVKVLPDNSSVINSSNTTAGVEIKVTTGCVYPATSLKFQWYYFKSGMAPVPYTDAMQVDTPANVSTVDCTAGDCGGDGVAQMTSAVLFEEDPDGEDYYLQAVITSLDVPENASNSVVVTSNVTYKINFSEGENSWLVDGKPSVGLIILLAVVVLIVGVTVTVAALMCLRGGDNPEKEKIINT